MSDSQFPLVSVIIRSMDRTELSDALTSVSAQTYPNIEVILVQANGNGHSDKGSWCGTFPLRSVSTGEPLARSQAANLGLLTANGSLIIFLDDDDWFLPHHVDTLTHVLISNEDIDVVYAGIECVRSTEDGTLEKVYVFNQPFDRTRLFVENYLPIHACLFRRRLLQRGCLFDENLDTYEDWDFWVQLARQTDFQFLDHIGAVYRIGQASGFGVTGTNDKVDFALRAFFQKWRKKWTEDELLAIATYAKYHSMYWDIRELLTEVQDEKTQQLQEMQANLYACQSEQKQEIESLKSKLSSLEKEKAEQKETLSWEKSSLIKEKDDLFHAHQNLLAEKESIWKKDQEGEMDKQNLLRSYQTMEQEKEKVSQKKQA